MFSITKSRRRGRIKESRNAEAQKPLSPEQSRQAYFQKMSAEASRKDTIAHSSTRKKNVKTAMSPSRTYYNPTYDDLTLDTLTSRFIPNDYRKQNELWRKIYSEDAVAGPALDLYKDMPWSNFGVLGINDPKIVQTYEDCLEAIDLESMLPFISLDFLMLGRFIPHFLFDSNKGYWSRMILHDPDYIKVNPIPIPGFAPKLDLIPTDAMKQFAMSNDPRDIAAKQQLSQDLLQYLVQGKPIPLDPRNTSYIPRMSSASNSVGTSIYTRILDIIAYQKGLMQGSQAAIRRRLGAVRTVTVGNEDWEPTLDEINEIVEALLAAEEDPVGAVIGVRQGVEFSEAGGGSAQDILKISDEWQFISEAKMQALGINEGFLSGDATYSCCHFDTLVPTVEHGILKIGEIEKLLSTTDAIEEKKPYPVTMTTDSRFGPDKTKVWLYNGSAPTLCVTTERGNEFTGTPSHPLLVLKGLTPEFVPLKSLTNGDLLCLSTNKVVRTDKLPLDLSPALQETEETEILCLECGKKFKNLGAHIRTHGFANSAAYLEKYPNTPLVSDSYKMHVSNGSLKPFRKPDYMSPMLASVLGFLTAEGWHDHNSFSLSNSNARILDTFEGFVSEVFGLTGTRHLLMNKGTKQIINDVETICNKDIFFTKFDSVTVCRWLTEIGFTQSKAFDKEVPWSILQADEQSQLAFLAAFLDGDGCIRDKDERVSFISGSDTLLRGLQAILNAHGFIPRRKGRFLTLDRHDSLELYNRLTPYVTAKDLKKKHNLKSRNRFGIPIDYLRDFLDSRKTKTNQYGTSYLADNGKEVIISWHKIGKHPLQDEKRLLYDRYDKGEYDLILQELAKISPLVTKQLQYLFDKKYDFTSITDIEDAGINPVYDLSMEDRDNRSFVANGIISSNTVEVLLSVFLERIRAHRNFITKYFIEDRILKPIAEINGFYRTPEKRVAHRYRMARTNEELLIPSIEFSKNLRPIADREYLDILEMAQERGLPVTLKTWATFAGFDLEDELERLPEDLELRKSLREYQAATNPDYADKILSITQDSGLVVPLRIWAQSIGLDLDELAVAMEDDVAMRRKFRQWALQASPEMADRIRDAIEQGVPVPIAEVASSYGLSLERLLDVKEDDLALREEIKKWLTAVSPEARDFLEMAQDKGIPINLETWAKVLGLNLEDLVSKAPEDIELRKELTPWRNAAEGEFEGDEGKGGFGDEGGLGDEEEGDFGAMPGFGEEEEGGEEEMPGLPDLGEIPEEGQPPQILEVDKEDLPELMEKAKDKYPDADIPEMPEEVKEELETPESPEATEEREPTEEELAVEEQELPVPPKAEKRPVRKLTPKQEEKLTKSIREVLIDALKNHKKAVSTAKVATKLYKKGYFSLADSLYRQGVMATPDDVPVDLGYLLDGILPNDIHPPQGYLKSDVFEYKTVNIECKEWNTLMTYLNQTGHGTSKSWGQSIAEFLRTKSPYPAHNHIGVVCVGKVNILRSRKTNQIKIIPEKSTTSEEHYQFTYYRVNVLKRPSEIDPKKLMILDLGRIFQSQLVLSENRYVSPLSKQEGLPRKEDAPLPDITQEKILEDQTNNEQPNQVVFNVNVSKDVVDQVLHIMKSLPIWSRDNKFVDLKQKDAEVIVKKVVKSQQQGHSERYATKMGMFNPKKRQLMQYVLARLGLIKDVSLDPDVAADIVQHLTKKVPQSANPEQINELFTMAILQTHKKDNTPSYKKSSRSMQNPQRWPMASNQLLTGHIPKR